MVDFDVQTFLRDMRNEQNDAHSKLEEKIDGLKTTISNHETRLTVVENDRSTLRWFFGSIIAAAIGFVVSLWKH